MAEEINDLFGIQEETEQNATPTQAVVAEEPINEQTEEVVDDEDTTEEDCGETEQATDEEKSAGSAEQETKEKKLSPYEQIVLNEMQRRANEGDQALATAMQSKDKDIHSCWSYITAQARKKASGNCAMIEDAEVFGWAVHYYTESKETIEKECPSLKPYVPKKAEKTAEQKKREETEKKVKANPLLDALMKRGAKITDSGEIAVTKTTEKKDDKGNILSAKIVKTDAEGTRTTTIKKDGQTYTMTEFSLF
jgi:hypothetical protein